MPWKVEVHGSSLDFILLFIFGSYDRETSIHCTLELSSTVWKQKTRSSIKTALLVKGSSQSVGLTFRQVQASEADAAGHVSIEAVTPNSPAAMADLQRGDRLIAIGVLPVGVKVTSSVQVLKLIKQAGDRVQVFYERPVGHQNQQGASIQEVMNQLDDPNDITPYYQQNFEEDVASVTSLECAEFKDVEAEFEDIVCDLKLSSSEVKEEALSATNQSPKRTVTPLTAKPSGTTSPNLNRKVNQANQPPLKSQQKEANKLAPSKSNELQETAQQTSKPSQGQTNKPPVPPRPQHKLASSSPEVHSPPESSDFISEKTERLPVPPPLLPPPSNNGERSAEKNVSKSTNQSEDTTVPKQNANKQEIPKDKLSDNFICTKDNADDCPSWESSEITYRNRYGKWTKAVCMFEIESQHKYLNVALWCRNPFKIGDLICLGYVSVKIEEIALECLCVSSMESQSTFRLNAPELKAIVSRTALRSLCTHKGFNESLCYGDITINFRYLKEGESDNTSFLLEKESDSVVQDEPPVLVKEETFSQTVITESKHSFQDTQFQNPTHCEYCKKKVWTKAASQCILCAYVCHKKCQDKCLADNPYCVAPERRVDLETKSPLNRTAGLTRQILNTSTRLLNLRQVSKTRLPEQGSDIAEPSPKQTPNTSDNESSDTETCSGNSPSKQPASTGSKLARKEGGLDDSVFIAVKEIGRDLYRGLPTDERSQKLEFMLDKLQNEIDQELEHNNSLVKEKKETTDARKKSLINAAISKSGERLQALTLLMIHYRAGIEDLESLESLAAEQQTKKILRSPEEPSVTDEVDDISLVSQEAPQMTDNIPMEETADPTETSS
ncbi:PDZ domain-containing protein 8-like [Protopterus annectens]|uniref:PDZ domain-containing protein 8-like n=1 Tax=Protopterus annectens TaxID=7888 RepID=UPI001CF9361B|nr:PDZ domain-containing protein 8-like [Protopterus annectens]